MRPLRDQLRAPVPGTGRPHGGPRIPRPAAATTVIAVVAVLTGMAALAAELARYLSYQAPAYDLGFFDQVVERTARGHAWQSSFLS
ncbi:MAG: hypothetical protein ABR541_00395, partial [Candidatus Dormibacteria bacterium]